MYGLNKDTIDVIKNVFFSFSEVEQVVIYGSRAKGNYREGSDIDLSLKGKNLTLSILNKISWGLDDLMLPYTFDLSIYNQIDNQGLKDHILRVGLVFYEKDPSN